MTLVLLVLGFVFSLFPYTQILEIDTYNQPYALVFSALGAIGTLGSANRQFPRGDFIILLLMVGCGLLAFLFTALSNIALQDLKYILVYISPIVFCMAGFSLSYRYPILTDRLLVGSAIVWLAVGVIQTVYDPAFLSRLIGSFADVAKEVVESGRGVVGLAPEPTHYGFHLIVLAAAMAVVRQRLVLPLICLAGALLLARSSSALLTMVLGSILYLVIYTRRARILLIAVIPAYFIVQAVVLSDLLPDSLRVVVLLRSFFENPAIVISADASVNARIGGIYVGLYEIVTSLGVPHGLSTDEWLRQINRILSEHQWLYDISRSGIPSGLLIVVYQAGWFGLLLLMAMLRSMFAGIRWPFGAWLICVLFFVFMSQYSISTPGFGLVYGLILARRVRSSAVAALPAPMLTPAPAAPQQPVRPRRITGRPGTHVAVATSGGSGRG